MSLEPQTTAKARIITTKGPITVELWAKEIPVTSRLFLENALNQRFNGWLFNRVVPKFLIQAGSQDRLEETQIENEYHPRIKFNKRGLLGSVDENSSEFFITLDQAPELNNRNTLFGKIVDDSIFTALKISGGEINGEAPLYPTKIVSSEVVIPFFDDLKIDEKREQLNVKSLKVEKRKRKANVKLTLFDEDDDGSMGSVGLQIKMKSAVTNPRKKVKTEDKKEENEQMTDPEIEEKPTHPDTNHQNEILNQVSENEASQENKSSPTLENPSSISKSKRAQDTVELLKNFESHIKSTNLYKSKQSRTKDDRDLVPSFEFDSDRDSDFDNLSESDGADDDLFAHELKFEEEEIRDDLVTIDTRN